ncbi:CpsD/CapB family tyrosine-protein kinase [Domibacillus sp. PGB-M46]|uniref:CpsD/CapB family tyrosine-protein kinase n=1 Tax=Domibacillus sp. PGB-M46 TaxID=2910255 RepID=UPI001F56D932|nr:CpsD/CapB family tyrosine-protein kinase [Domibacillus sp. PGB-M46]MCI2252749.1 CpsD/CapB family tyrosine-protein kinase [Domibacillus sp. PGB-M46]
MIWNKSRQTAADKKALVTLFNPESAISDQFRIVRANLQFLAEENKQGAIIITSPGSGEGKSTTAANLAISMAQQKDRVLLIDANIKEPSIHSMFEVSNEAGLTNILMYDVKLEEVACQTELENLEILPSGSTSFSPAELLGGQEMKSFLNEVKSLYDVVVIDAPSVLDFSETRVLAHQCDGVLLVMNRYKTEVKHVQEAKRVLELADAHLIGGIMNEA